MISLPVSPADPPVSAYPYLLRPAAVHLRLSTRCDSNCKYCQREEWKSGHVKPEMDMPAHVWQAVRDNILPHVEGCEVVGLGEPTLAKLFPEVARGVVEDGKVLYFATNGHFLDRPHVLRSVGTAPRVSVSFDAATDATYVEIGRGKHGELASTLEKVKAFKRAIPGAHLHSQYTAGAYNIDELPDFIDLAASIGIEHVTMRWVQDHTLPREDVSLRFHRDRTLAATAAATERAAAHNIRFEAEQHEFSPTLPNAGGAIDAASPDARAARYLDYVPMTDITCPTTTTTFTTTTTVVTTTSTLTDGSTVPVTTTTTTSVVPESSLCATTGLYPPGAGSMVCCVTYNVPGLSGPPYYGQTQACDTYAFTQPTNSITGSTGTGTTFSTNITTTCDPTCTTITGPVTTTICAVTSTTCTTLTGTVTASTIGTVVAGLFVLTGTGGLTTVTNGTTFLSGGTTVTAGTTITAPSTTTTTITSTITTTTTSGSTITTVTSMTSILPYTFFAAAPPDIIPGPAVLASARQAPLLAPAASDSVQEMRAAPAALIVDHNGDAWTCFARHVVGNVLKDDFDTIVKKPAYQRWLHNRAGVGSPFADPWCLSCARTF